MREIFRHAWAYRTLQRAIGSQKMRPFRERVHLPNGTRVLELGCGPGIHAPYFAHCKYTGLDLSEDYIAGAKERYSCEFIVGDATSYRWPNKEFDLVFIHSVLHHLNDEQVLATFDRVLETLKPNGKFYLTDLILPDEWGIARFMAHIDRGNFPRPTEAWKALIQKKFTFDWYEEFPTGFLGREFWRLFYAELRVKTS